MEAKRARSATTAGTDHYRRRFPNAVAENHFRLQHNLWLSSIGIGTYLGNPDSVTDERYVESVVRAVELGVNVIDTAANYRFQRSERSIEAALKILTESGYTRDELVICTKGGYLPFDGAPPSDVRSYIEQTFVRPGIANLSDIVGGCHCMTPAYLQDQLEQSLHNLNLNCIDVYYIHNPESQLGAVSAKEFDARLQLAFESLEHNIRNGKIKNYGVATWNGFRQPPHAAGSHSLYRMVEIAREVGGDSHGFRFIQLPFNLAMPEALLAPTQSLPNGETTTVLEAAATLGITVMASASILQGRVTHDLSEAIREPLGSVATDAMTAIQFVRSAPGVTTALVGMSKTKHVEENLQLAAIPPASQADYQRLFVAK